ncbi:type II secretory pathway pseudopilin PulG [Staphylococcus pasteuri]
MMEQFQLIAIAILSILWAISTYKWVRAEKKAKKLDERIFTLQHKNRNLELDLKGLETYKMFQDGLKKQGVDCMGKYIVEVNEGVYLIVNKSDAYEYWEKYGTLLNSENFTFTKEYFKATRYDELSVAKYYASQCGGRILQHKPNLEVVE